MPCMRRSSMNADVGGLIQRSANTGITVTVAPTMMIHAAIFPASLRSGQRLVTVGGGGAVRAVCRHRARSLEQQRRRSAPPAEVVRHALGEGLPSARVAVESIARTRELVAQLRALAGIEFLVNFADQHRAEFIDQSAHRAHHSGVVSFRIDLDESETRQAIRNAGAQLAFEIASGDPQRVAMAVLLVVKSREVAAIAKRRIPVMKLELAVLGGGRQLSGSTAAARGRARVYS